VIGERLYQLNARDEQARWLIPFFRRVAPAAAALETIDVPLTVPANYCLLLKNTLVEVVSGGAQTLSTMLLFMTLRPPDVYVLDGFPNGGPAEVPGAFGELFFPRSYHDILVPPDTIITTRGNWSAGVAVNFIALNVVGVLIPAGNITRT